MIVGNCCDCSAVHEHKYYLTDGYCWPLTRHYRSFNEGILTERRICCLCNMLMISIHSAFSIVIEILQAACLCFGACLRS
jgi:hypothetical protein